jgi:hypothetical protein
MPRALLIALLALLAAPASGRAADRCVHHRGEHELARSAQAVVTERWRIPTADSGASDTQTIIGCSRATGKRRVVATLESNTSAGDRVEGLRLAGTRIAYVEYMSVKEFGGTTIVADDAVHGGRHRDLAGGWPFSSFESGVLSWAVDATGNVAWVAAHGLRRSVLLRRPGVDLRQVDSGTDLTDVTLAGGVLRWRHGGTWRALPIALPPSACGDRRAITGTAEVDLFFSATAFTACLRATGRSVTVPTPSGSITAPADVAGPYVALSYDHSAIRVDLANGGYEAVPTRNAYTQVRVDDAGSLAWYDAPDGPAELWVRDASGTRQVAGRLGGLGELFRDGPVLSDINGPVVTLTP